MDNVLKDTIDFAGLKVSLASPEDIKNWSHGEVVKPETINYRTLRPEKDGLFSESIFGPTRDYECYCGKYKRIRYRGIVCDKCGVEVTQARVRRERLGHITLAAPCAHVWFFKGAPSTLSFILDMPPRALEAVIYFAQYLVTSVDKDQKKEAQTRLEKLMEEKTAEVRKVYEEKVDQVKEDEEKESKEIKERIKGKEQLTMALHELDLKIKQRMQALREEQTAEEERAKNILNSLSDKVKSLRTLSLLTEDEYLKLNDYEINSFFTVGMGAEAILEALGHIDFETLVKQLREETTKTSGQRYLKAAKRLRVVEGMRKANISPTWMIVKILPVIPPDLRPMVQLPGGRFATSDLNDLYRRVINRNNRLKHLIELGAPEIILRNEKRMLQEAVDALIDSSQGKTAERRRRAGQALRSLSDMLRGKQGRFRQNLLGKRVDYSGRSVIVVGPELKLSQCGLPKEMALEMFKPYVLREMIMKGLAPNVRSAKNMLEHRPPEVFDILEEITKHHPVLLNRAPTLHKLGIQAFYPILIEGNAIQIHPCVCNGFGADFDGDQMAIHIPLSKEAQEEAINLVMAEKNLLKPSDGSPATVPTREMVLGIFYLTSIDPNLPPSDHVFSDPSEAVTAYQTGHLPLRLMVKVRLNGEIIDTTVGRLIFNEVLPEGLRFINDQLRLGAVRQLITKALQICQQEEVVNLIDNLKDIGFKMATTSGLSVSVFDCQILPGKEKIIGEANDKVAQIEGNFKDGLITQEEKRRLIREIWMETTENLAALTWDALPSQSSVKMIVDSGATRASRDQIKQLSAMRGLVVDPLGKIVDLPTKSNFREGLNVFEYVTSARGSRKGLTDTAIKTSDAGYLTRRLVDVAHDVLVREEDCGTDQGLEIRKEGQRAKMFRNRLAGRILAQDICDPKTKKVLVRAGELLNEANIELIEAKEIKKIIVRSPLTCKSRYGVCVHCYGWDLGSKAMVTIGGPVGVVAAQSIGEPGTQLTLRTKHSGGVVGLDVTQGLPRVEELFEVRVPKALSPLAEISGKVSVDETDEGYKVTIRDASTKPVQEREYFIPLTSSLKVKDKEKAEAGTQLASGVLDIKEVLSVKGLRAAQEYLIEEIQGVYESQGIPIHDKHFEVIVRKMSDKLRIKAPGDTVFLPGELVSKVKFDEENERMEKGKEEKATAHITILGITRASLYTDSWLSAASFQSTTSVLAEAAIFAKEDKLLGLKENVIIGRLIPVTQERAEMKS
ncbi:MAG: DNA-directed RNA polymerase subunit beta' [bacterium]|nr:DNA-directed RNA polymerase subunit beta' [bacterium]